MMLTYSHGSAVTLYIHAVRFNVFDLQYRDELLSQRVCRGLFWARVLRYQAVEEARFRMMIILGIVLIRSAACTQWVP